MGLTSLRSFCWTSAGFIARGQSREWVRDCARCSTTRRRRAAQTALAYRCSSGTDAFSLAGSSIASVSKTFKATSSGSAVGLVRWWRR